MSGIEVPVFETPFRTKARRLRTPLARNFDPAEWEKAYSLIEHPDPADRKLLEAAIWIGREVKALDAASPSPFRTLCAEQAIALGIALVNREYWISTESTERELAELSLESPASFDYLSNLRYENIYGQKMSAADFVENAIEALSSWIYDARRICPPDEPGSEEDLWGLAGSAIHYYSMRRVLKCLFDEALLLGTALDETGSWWQSRDRQLDEVRKAWQARAESNLMDEPQLLAMQWPHITPSQRRALALPRSVGEVRWTVNGWNGKVRRMEYLSKRPRGFPLEKRALEGSYLGFFLDEELPLAPGLTAALIHRAWWVIADLAKHIEKAARKAGEQGALTLLQAAYATTETELARIITAVLRISADQAKDIIAFLTLREGEAHKGERPGADPGKGDRGLWSAPLISCREGSLLIPQAIFNIGDPIYRVEAWLERGGIDDSALERRGDRYEEKCRAGLVAAMGENRIFKDAHIAPHGIAKNRSFPHQTDLLFQIGSRAFVGEIKCWLTPADAHHWDRFYRIRLPEAVEQALVRADALRANREVLASALGIPRVQADALKICPIVVLNLSAGFSLVSRGCRIIDADFLRSYLRSPEMTSGVAMHYGKPVAQQVVSLYTSEKDASDSFDRIMADPWSLRRFRDRFERADIAYPRPTGGTFEIETLFRGNLTPEEQIDQASLAEWIRGK